jgi:hypothetical protein
MSLKHLYNYPNFVMFIQDPPGLPTIHVSNYNGDSVQVRNGNISIIESETINATCFSPSKPKLTYKLTKEQSFKTLSTNVLKFVNISRYESGAYLCNAENAMNRSIGKTVVGKNNSQLFLNILCKYKIYTLINNVLWLIEDTSISGTKIFPGISLERFSNFKKKKISIGSYLRFTMFIYFFWYLQLVFQIMSFLLNSLYFTCREKLLKHLI